MKTGALGFRRLVKPRLQNLGRDERFGLVFRHQEFDHLLGVDLLLAGCGLALERFGSLIGQQFAVGIQYGEVRQGGPDGRLESLRKVPHSSDRPRWSAIQIRRATCAQAQHPF